MCPIACGAPAPATVPTPAPPPAAPAAPVGVPAPPAEPWTGQRIVAVGDLHGDLRRAKEALALLGVTDASGHWVGGDAVLVQTGDTVDRGPDSRGVLAWLRELEQEAPRSGGRVVALLGNHEVMNLRDDWRYVAPEDLAAYGGEAERRAAFGKGGVDGAWLRTLGVAARLGDTVFVHGGILPVHATGGVDEINRKARMAMDAPGHPAILGEDGPLWYRGYVQDPEDAACPELQRALRLLGARRMVVGHTTRRDGKVQARCGGALLVIDIGISDHYGAHVGAIELKGGTDAWVRYPSSTEDLPDPGAGP